MKQFFAIGLLPLFLAYGFINTNNTTPTGEIKSSTIEWKGYKVTGSHYGNIDIQSGKLQFDDNGALTGGKIVIEMNSITSSDLTSAYNGKLIGHLKSDDFFGVATYPTATLEITNVAAKGTPGDYKVTADLTIKNTTKSIKFYTNISDNDGMKVATADMKIDRSEYNVKYGSGSFFDNLGDKTIYDEFDINVKLVVE